MKYKFDNSLDERGKEKHLHTLDGVAMTGVSSVVGVLAKPLTWWASSLAVAKFGWIKKLDSRKSTKEEVEKNAIERLNVAINRLNEIKELSDEQYLSLLDEAYKAHSVKLEKSAKKGTDLHEVLERFVKSEMGKEVKLTEEETKLIQPFIDWSKENVKKFIASEAHCFSSRLFVGGIVDVVAELNDGTLAIIDFKSADKAYDNHFIQASGYAILAEENGLFDKTGQMNKKLEGKITKLIVVPFGAEVVVPQIKVGVVEEYKRGFESAVVLYRLLNK